MVLRLLNFMEDVDDLIVTVDAENEPMLGIVQGVLGEVAFAALSVSLLLLEIKSSEIPMASKSSKP